MSDALDLWPGDHTHAVVTLTSEGDEMQSDTPGGAGAGLTFTYRSSRRGVRQEPASHAGL